MTDIGHGQDQALQETGHAIDGFSCFGAVPA
jgi:hypothetical protein